MEKNIIFYYGHCRQLNGDGKGLIEVSYGEIKIKNGDILKVKVCQQKGDIEWFINGEPERSYSMLQLTDRSIEWVPFVVVGQTNTQLEWVE